MPRDEPRRDDTGDRLRRALHAQLDGAEPAAPASVRAPGARRATRIPFGLVAVGASIVVVAALVGSRLPGTGGGHPGAVTIGSAVPGPSVLAGMMPAPVPPGLPGSAAPVPSAAIGTGAPSRQSSSSQPAATAVVAPGHGVAPPSVRVEPPPGLPSAPPPPRPTPTTTPAAQATGTVVVTLAQGGETVDVAVGQHLELQLGTAYQWSISVTGSGVLTAVSARLPTGVQGLWVAERGGTASVQAIGNPPCLQAKPPCAMPSREFAITVIVR
jgi:hypothetical protein